MLFIWVMLLKEINRFLFGIDYSVSQSHKVQLRVKTIPYSLIPETLLKTIRLEKKVSHSFAEITNLLLVMLCTGFLILYLYSVL